MVTRATPILATSDVVATIAFYKEVLGFDQSWIWGNPATFGGASWGSVSVMFCHDPDLASKVEGHQLWLDADEIDSLYSKHIERGATIVSPIEDKPWNRREYTVRDPNGYHLRIGGQPSHQSKGTGVFPEGVTLSAGMPTQEEFLRVTSSAFGNNPDRVQDMERAWTGIVARDPQGDAIGVLLIMQDAQGWFSVWDVVVLPEWQGRRIGSAMMNKALELIRADSPGAHVFLFTYKDGFYERLGFSKESVHSKRV